MSAYIPFLFLIFATTLLVSGFYWIVVRPVLVKQVIYRLFERRDALRTMAIKEQINRNSADYQEVEEVICKTIDFSSSMTLGSLLWTSMFFSREIDDMEVVEASCGETAAMREKTVGDALKLMALNSPIIFGVLALSAGVLWIFGRFNQMLVLKRAEAFVDRLPSSPHGMGWA